MVRSLVFEEWKIKKKKPSKKIIFAGYDNHASQEPHRQRTRQKPPKTAMAPTKTRKRPAISRKK
jgi:hypothetical protein